MVCIRPQNVILRDNESRGRRGSVSICLIFDYYDQKIGCASMMEAGAWSIIDDVVLKRTSVAQGRKMQGGHNEQMGQTASYYRG